MSEGPLVRKIIRALYGVRIPERAPAYYHPATSNAELNRPLKLYDAKVVALVMSSGTYHQLLVEDKHQDYTQPFQSTVTNKGESTPIRVTGIRVIFDETSPLGRIEAVTRIFSL